jgi:hypothetical protein
MEIETKLSLSKIEELYNQIIFTQAKPKTLDEFMKLSLIKRLVKKVINEMREEGFTKIKISTLEMFK